MECGKCHTSDVTIAHVKECYGIGADVRIRESNFTPMGPAKPRVLPARAREAIRQEERNRALFREGREHGFTQHCPECVAGGHEPFRNVTQELDQQRYEEEENFLANGYDRHEALREPVPDYRPNKFGGKCRRCQQYVEAEKGKLVGSRGNWGVEHVGDCPERPKEQAYPVPDVPAGHYAVKSRTGNNDIDFFRVDRPEKGDYEGRVFVKRVIGGKPDRNIRRSEKLAVLADIVKMGVHQSALLYAQKIRSCSKCNRHLTMYASRQLGMGETCATHRGLGEVWAQIQSEWERSNPGRDAKDLGENEGWLEGYTAKDELHRQDALSAAEDATWD